MQLRRTLTIAVMLGAIGKEGFREAVGAIIAEVRRKGIVESNLLSYSMNVSPNYAAKLLQTAVAMADPHLRHKKQRNRMECCPSIS